MSSARIDRWSALVLFVLVAGWLIGPAAIRISSPAASPASGAQELLDDRRPLAIDGPGWPPSQGLLVAEVVTRGGGASDQYVELYNASAVPLSLAELELVYVTASGVTVTRKQAWTDLVLPAHRHLLIANSAGAFAAAADGVFSGGFSTSGGSLVLRSLGGTVIDSLSWGSAASPYVEGTPGAAPPTGSSLERLPGGSLGSGLDRNDNWADTHVQSLPLAQNLAAPPTPGDASATDAPTTGNPATAAPAATPPGPSPSAEAEPPFEGEPPYPDDEEAPDPSAMPIPSTTPVPSSSPEPVTTSGSSISPHPTVTPATAPPDPTISPPPSSPTAPTPTAAPSPTPSPEPTPTPALTATPTPTPSATPAPPTIGELRNRPLGSTVTVHGVLTTPLGLTESGRGAFVRDETAGIALYLGSGTWPAATAGGAVMGSAITASGILESRFSLLTVRVASVADVTVGEPASIPAPDGTSTGAVGEQFEGQLVAVEGLISDGISMLSDGFSTAIDDGTGSLRVIVAGATGVSPEELPRGRHLRLVGVVGQRDSSGTGLAGYRLHLRSTGDITPIVVDTPSPPPTAGPTASTPGSPGSGTPPPVSPAPSQPPASPAPSQPPPISIAQARLLAIGQQVRVQGVVTVAAGRILGERTVCIQDSTAAICVRLPDATANPAPGTLLLAEGALAAPYGNLELRPGTGGVIQVGEAALPAVRALRLADLGETTEGLLARVEGKVKSVSAAASGTITLVLEDGSGEGRVFIHAALGSARADFATGQQLAVTGIVGDRLGLYRIWPRERADLKLQAPAPGPTPRTTPGGPAKGTPSAPPKPGDSSAGGVRVSIAEALRRVGERVTVEGIVSAPAALLDADGRRVTIQDGNAAILLRLPVGVAAPAIGQKLRATGEVGMYYGAPQLAATDAPVTLGRAGLDITRLARAPIAASFEWRLVSVSGTVESVQRSGDAWRAELRLADGSVPIVGLARSGIAPEALVKGRSAIVAGIVRRAYPTATDQRYAIVPRSSSDISLGGAGPSGGPDGAGGGSSPVPGPSAGNTPVPSGPSAGGAGGGPTGGSAVALSELALHVGQRVMVGGRVTLVAADHVLIDDGTAGATLLLAGETRLLALRLRPGMLLNAAGLVERDPVAGLRVLIGDPADLLIGISAPPGPRSTPSTPAPADMAVPSAGQPAAQGSQMGQAEDDRLLALLGMLALLGAVTGSAGAFLARRTRHWPAAVAAIKRLRARLATLIRA